MAREREVKSNFREFQDWLDKHAEYEAIVDGANIGLYQQNFADGGFCLTQGSSMLLGVEGNGHLLSCIIDVSGDLWKILTTENWSSGWVKAFFMPHRVVPMTIAIGSMLL